MNSVHYLLRRLGTCYRQHTRVHFAHQVATTFRRLGAQASGHDHLAVFSKGFANCVQAFLDCIVNESACIHNHKVSALEGF